MQAVIEVADVLKEKVEEIGFKTSKFTNQKVNSTGSAPLRSPLSSSVSPFSEGAVSDHL